jgi:hypothetical protein
LLILKILPILSKHLLLFPRLPPVTLNAQKLLSRIYRSTGLPYRDQSRNAAYRYLQSSDRKRCQAGFLYLYHTVTSTPRHNRVSRFTANGDVAVANSEVVILELDNLSSATNHNGGAIHFGPDGKLYVAVGENATPTNAQTLANRLGKMLRINSDGSIPTDNPFFNTASGDNRSIWALGLRSRVRRQSAGLRFVHAGGGKTA